jgi:hypothetical protein
VLLHQTILKLSHKVPDFRGQYKAVVLPALCFLQFLERKILFATHLSRWFDSVFFIHIYSFDPPHVDVVMEINMFQKLKMLILVFLFFEEKRKTPARATQRGIEWKRNDHEYLSVKGAK